MITKMTDEKGTEKYAFKIIWFEEFCFCLEFFVIYGKYLYIVIYIAEKEEKKNGYLRILYMLG